MPIEPIKNDADHKAALGRINELWKAPEGSAEGYELDALVTLVERYEQVRWPIESSTPLEMLKFMMEQQERTQSDLAALLGSRSRASEILSGRRSMTLDQIRLIAHHWKIPAALLIGELETAAA